MAHKPRHGQQRAPDRSGSVYKDETPHDVGALRHEVRNGQAPEDATAGKSGRGNGNEVDPEKHRLRRKHWLQRG